jgi:hypothetical protein
MNGVIGYAELVHELSEGEELRKYAQVILDSSQHLLSLAELHPRYGAGGGGQRAAVAGTGGGR